MNKYEKLLNEAYEDGVNVDEDFPFEGKTSGLYIDGNIALSNKLETSVEKNCIIAEELGHHHTTTGDILDPTVAWNRKHERQARLWAYNKRIGLQGLIDAYEHGCQNCHETADYLEVTEQFLQECISNYTAKYGEGIVINNYYIMFIPYFGVGKLVK